MNPEAFSHSLAAFPKAVHELLNDVVREQAVLPATEVGRLCAELDLSRSQLMLKLLPVAAALAHAPVSGFSVGAVAAGVPSSGDGLSPLSLGANVEFLGESLDITVHAEQSAVLNAWMAGAHGISALAVSAAPCGYCRQFLNELVTASELQILLPAHEGAAAETFELADLLPRSFGPAMT